MDGRQIGMLIGLIATLIFSVLFSFAETSFTSANKVRLKNLEQHGKKRATRVLAMLENYDKVISSVIIGNNIAAVVAASLGAIFFTSFVRFAEYYPYNPIGVPEQVMVTISAVVVTFLIVALGEILPKSIAKERPEKTAMAIFPFVIVVYYILYPINVLFSWWKKGIAKLFKFKGDDKIDSDELMGYVDAAQSEGGISEDEGNLLRSAIEFDDLDAVDIMTPRVNVIAVNINASREKVARKFQEHSFSRMPVYQESIDKIVGIVLEKDFYFVPAQDFALKNIIKPTLNMPENIKISTALKLMQKAKKHMAVVVDEYGGTSGIVTLEDIIEEIVGEIYDEHDDVEELITPISDTEFMVDGKEHVINFFKHIHQEVPEEIESVTMGGLAMEVAQSIPKVGEEFEFQNLKIKIVKATVKRIAQIKVSVLEVKESE